MVRPVSGKGYIDPTKQPTHGGKVSKSLKEIQKKTSEFALGRGQGYFGAGKPASFSDTPPRTSKQVTQAASSTLIKPARRK
jgi:hypothetical protein